jgi:hypothetical protein
MVALIVLKQQENKTQINFNNPLFSPKFAQH